MLDLRHAPPAADPAAKAPPHPQHSTVHTAHTASYTSAGPTLPPPPPMEVGGRMDASAAALDPEQVHPDLDQVFPDPLDLESGEGPRAVVTASHGAGGQGPRL